jgi:hypothetical protein
MSVRRTRTRHMAFVNGNRELVARSLVLSATQRKARTEIPVRLRPIEFELSRGFAKVFR